MITATVLPPSEEMFFSGYCLAALGEHIEVAVCNRAEHLVLCAAAEQFACRITGSMQMSAAGFSPLTARAYRVGGNYVIGYARLTERVVLAHKLCKRKRGRAVGHLYVYREEVLAVPRLSQKKESEIVLPKLRHFAHFGDEGLYPCLIFAAGTNFMPQFAITWALRFFALNVGVVSAGRWEDTA